MITEELREEIVSRWKKGDKISQISKEIGVSRPTIRKIIEEHKKNRNWFFMKSPREDDFIRIVVRAPYSYNPLKEEVGAIERLALGVEMFEVDTLIRKIVELETAEEIIYNFKRAPPGLSVLYVRKSKLVGKYRRLSS